MRYDIAIVGGGPGGYTAAHEAARRGRSVVLFEAGLMGGTCLNRGCIPTKALIHAAQAYADMRGAGGLDITCEAASYDFAAMHARKDDVVARLRTGVERLMHDDGTCVVHGHAQVGTGGTVTCAGEPFEAGDVILATGAQPSRIPVTGFDLAGVGTSDDLLEGASLDVRSIVIIGGGVIGVECAQIYANLGCKVTILEAMERILPPMDREISQRVTMLLKRCGVTIETKARVCAITGEPGDMAVTYTDRQGKVLEACGEAVLLATGRKAATEGLFEPGAEPVLERGAVVTNTAGLTSVPHLYAIGDVRAHTIQLAHVAAAQARNVVAVICGEKPPVDEAVVPSCVYTSPEVASVGRTADEAKAAGFSVRCTKQVVGANAKCLVEGSEMGYVKLVCDETTGQVLGAQLVCPRATDLVAELALAIHLGATAQDVAATIHPHPTVSEMVLDAARAYQAG